MGGPGEEPQLTIRPAGDRAVLIDLPPEIDPLALHAAAQSLRDLPRVVRCTPGRNSLFVVFSAPIADGELREAIAGAQALEFSAAEHRIPVSFRDADAPDLPPLLQHASITRDQFLERIVSITFIARHLGFRPGFAYLDGLPAEWHMPRLARPRDRVPRGSFAVAGASAAFYPEPSPGGWNLLGRTDVVLWDSSREQPNLISAGDRILIEPIR